jgi:hypothetical protein
MATSENRELRITGQFRDRMSQGLTKVRAQVGKTQAAFVKFGKGITAPLRLAGKAIDGVASKILSAKNLVLGFVAVVAVRRTFGLFQGIADDLDEVVKTADRLQATTESLSALRFVGELNAVAFTEISSALAIFSRNLEAARRGSLAQADAFRELGLNLEELADLQRIDLIDLLADVADGFEQVGSATERNNALLTVFGRSGSRLGPLLAGGSAAIRELAEEAERLGVVFDRDSLNRAAAFNDALARFRTSLRGVGEALFLEVAPGISAVFTQLAKTVSDNRDRIVAVFRDLGRGFIGVLDLMADAVIEFIDTLERIPGVSLFDSSDLERELREVEQQLAEFIRRRDAAARAAVEPFATAMAQARDPADRSAIRLERQQALQRAEAEFLATVSQAELGLAERRQELLQVIGDGLSGQLRQARQRFADAIEQLVEAATPTGESAAAEAGAAAGDAFRKAFEDAGGGGAASQGDIRGQAAEGTRFLNLQRTLLSVLPATEDVQRALAATNAELQLLSTGNQALEFFESGRIGAQELAQAFEDLGAAAEREQARIGRTIEQQSLGFEQQVLGLDVQTQAVRTRLAEINGELQRLGFEQAFDDGRISAEQLAQALEGVEQATERATARARGDFAQGFADGAQQAAAALLDMTKIGQEAATSLINNGVNALSDALVDVATGAGDAREAFNEFAEATLRQLSQLITRALILRSLSAVGLTFETGGVMMGRMRRPETLPVNEYAQGGIARSPQVAVFGEGRGAEAFVPLPDGRRIPVDMQGGGGGGLTIVVQTVDSKDTSRWLLENRGLLLSVQQNGLETSTASRRAVRQVT